MFFFITLNFSFLTTNCVNAIDMQSSQYKIQMSNVNSGSDYMTGSGSRLSMTLGQLAAEEFKSNGYLLKAGFQYINSIIPFSFSISNTNIDIGTVLPNTPATGATTLTVSFGSSGEYQVTVGKETMLKTFTDDFIPDTECDSGYSCTISSANQWTTTSALGFGYNMSGTDITADFIDGDYFRPFSSSTSPVIIMSNSNVTLNATPTPNPNPTIPALPTGTPRDIYHESTITFKVNVDANQQAGTYQTVIDFVATPSY